MRFLAKAAVVALALLMGFASLPAEAKKTTGTFEGTVAYRAKAKINGKDGAKFVADRQVDVSLQINDKFFIMTLTVRDGLGGERETLISGGIKRKAGGTVVFKADLGTREDFDDVTDLLIGFGGTDDFSGQIVGSGVKKLTGSFNPGKDGSGKLVFGLEQKGQVLVTEGGALASGEGRSDVKVFGSLQQQQ